MGFMNKISVFVIIFCLPMFLFSQINPEKAISCADTIYFTSGKNIITTVTSANNRVIKFYDCFENVSKVLFTGDISKICYRSNTTKTYRPFLVSPEIYESKSGCKGDTIYFVTGKMLVVNNIISATEKVIKFYKCGSVSRNSLFASDISKINYADGKVKSYRPFLVIPEVFNSKEGCVGDTIHFKSGRILVVKKVIMATDKVIKYYNCGSTNRKSLFTGDVGKVVYSDGTIKEYASR